MCYECNLERERLIVDYYFTVDGLNAGLKRLPDIGPEIDGLHNAIDELTNQISITEDESEINRLKMEKDLKTTQVLALYEEKRLIEVNIVPTNLRIAAIVGALDGYGTACNHETLCPVCGNTVATCFCEIFTCDLCNHIITQCTCSVYPCSQCGFDSAYCGHNGPFEP